MDVENQNSLPLARPAYRNRWRNLFSAKGLYESLQPLFLLLYWHGLMVYSIKANADGKKELRHSLWSHLNVFFHLTLYIVCYIMTLMNNFESVAGYFFQSKISRFGDFMQILSGFIGVTVIYITAIIPKHYVQNCLQFIQEIDQCLLRVGVRIMYSKILRYSCIFIVAMILIDILYTAASFQILKSANEEPSLYLHITFILQHTVVLTAIAMFSCFTKLIEARFTMLHKVLQNLYHQWETRNIKTLSRKQRSLQCFDSFSTQTIASKSPCEIVQESMEIHQLICEAASMANKYFTCQLLTIISTAFLIIVFDAYYVLETLLGKSRRESKFKTIEFVTFFSCQMILYVIAIISVVEGSNRTIKKSEKTGSIVHALLNRAKTLDVKEKLQQFSMQLMHLKINFTAGGLFNIDRSLYFTISGALTTYLTILLQFTANSPSGLSQDCVVKQPMTSLSLPPVLINSTSI
uniref:Gustatory receptor n=1 Tax=Glossina pallidipes TaxID=7398 RepID=A0A1B0A5U7_GLOPL